jgi:predicted MFS family arabinose efflux permease
LEVKLKSRIQSLQHWLFVIPPPIKLLTLGVFVNRLAGFFTTFLALILAIRGFTAWQISLALALVSIFGIVGVSVGTFVASQVGNRWTIVLSTAGMGLLTALLALPTPYPVTVSIACCISAFNRAYMPASAAIISKLTPTSERVSMFGSQRWGSSCSSIRRISANTLNHHITAL